MEFVNENNFQENKCFFVQFFQLLIFQKIMDVFW